MPWGKNIIKMQTGTKVHIEGLTKIGSHDMVVQPSWTKLGSTLASTKRVVPPKLRFMVGDNKKKTSFNDLNSNLS